MVHCSQSTDCTILWNLDSSKTVKNATQSCGHFSLNTNFQWINFLWARFKTEFGKVHRNISMCIHAQWYHKLRRELRRDYCKSISAHYLTLKKSKKLQMPMSWEDIGWARCLKRQICSARANSPRKKWKGSQLTRFGRASRLSMAMVCAITPSRTLESILCFLRRSESVCFLRRCSGR